MAIRTRQMAAAFLFHGTKILLMHKRGSRWQRQTVPFYSAIGGHLEPEELNDPYAACLREIEEETGLAASDLENLQLRYVLLRLKEDEIRQQFIYFGRVKHDQVVASDEGELGWHEIAELASLHSSHIHHAVLRHYQENPDQAHIYTGTMSIASDGQPIVHWQVLRDPGVF
ncbi:8-oxo-dGTP diphosphatase [Paenibacillus phyllosphaerae]|uniref:8-oxo-dGTP diphosphatase n=1 Tax=Paenibacillus phyllosphaerae TaxID=274593 RepID=A0A7W5AXD6_9BACL|nr:NUDIX domain-containing protein [Paenibacillus phyllosphaerae]MBB3109996.1 8-oxo-dGTP diphosphatase [Paenibacillus phyllosphaerae]